MQNQSFDYKKEQLINSYISIPTKQTINMFVKVCFMNETANFEKYYRNLRELDREIAYFSLRKSKEDKEYYYSKFPNSKNEYLSYENIIPNKFEDIIISDLSIEILNFIYFEYFLFKQVKSFKENFNFLVDEFLKTKIHQLTSLENEFIELKKRQELLSVDELGFEGIDYHRLYDLIETSHKEVWLFIESRFNLIKSNNKNSVSKEAREARLLKVIDEANLDLFYKFEDWLIKKEYLDENLRWFNGYGKKSCFMRFYLKCIEHKLIKRGAWNKLIRRLSDIYEIDGVDKHDYGIDRCDEAEAKKPNEFKDLDVVKSQHNLNYKNN